MKAYYVKTRKRRLQLLKERQKRTKRENQLQVLAYLKTHPCVGCGESDPVVLQFDHVRGKKRGAVGNMVHHCFSWAVIEKEIAKCDVRCANCHIRKTAKQLWGKNPKLG